MRRFGGSGGTEKISRELAAGLVDRAHEVDVYAARAEHVPDRVGLHTIGRDNRVAFFRASYDVPRHEYDVVLGFGRSHGHDVFRAGGGSHAAWMERRDRTPWQRVRSAWSFSEQFELRVDRQAVTSAREVICNSQLGIDDVVCTYGVSRDRVTLVRNGVDLQRFAPNLRLREQIRDAWGCTGRIALFLGSGYARKGLDSAVSAFELAAGTDDRLVVVGADPHADRFHERIAERLGDRLVWLGARPDPERWLVAADATLLPTRYDPSANSTLEALACGVPPVTTAFDGASEIVPDSELVVSDPDDIDALASALRYAWDAHAEHRSRYRRAAEAWPGSRMVDEVCGVLERVAAERAS